jgi:hypothetical protein
MSIPLPLRGNYAFRLVAIVAPYHSGCPGLQNDSSNIVSVSVVCPTALNADQISVNPTTISAIADGNFICE